LAPLRTLRDNAYISLFLCAIFLIGCLQINRHSSGANIKHGAQYHLVQMQRYVSQDVTGGNMKLGSSGKVIRSRERSGSMGIDLQLKVETLR